MAVLDYEGIWKETLIQLRNDLGEEEFSGWFSELNYLRTRFDEQTGNGSVVIGVPSVFHRDKVSSRYQKAINLKLKQLSGKELTLELEIYKKNKSETEKNDKSPVLPVKNEETPVETKAPPK